MESTLHPPLTGDTAEKFPCIKVRKFCTTGHPSDTPSKVVALFTGLSECTVLYADYDTGYRVGQHFKGVACYSDFQTYGGEVRLRN